MQFVKYEYSVSALVRYSEPDLQVLIAAGLAHYDGKCKAACLVGGFLYGMQNYLTLVRPDLPEWSLTCDKLGIIDKILEMAPDAKDLKQNVQEIVKLISIRERQLC